MWPVDPVAIKSLKFDDQIYLILYSSISVDIFDVLKGTVVNRLSEHFWSNVFVQKLSICRNRAASNET